MQLCQQRRQTQHMSRAQRTALKHTAGVFRVPYTHIQHSSSLRYLVLKQIPQPVCESRDEPAVSQQNLHKHTRPRTLPDNKQINVIHQTNIYIYIYIYIYIFLSLAHKSSHKSLGYICSNSQQYIVWVKIRDFSFMTKIIRIIRSCSMKIFSQFPTVNISKLNFLLLICIAKNLI